MRRFAGRPAASIWIACALAVCLAFAPAAAFAAPTNATIRAKQAEARQAEARLQELGDDLELKQTDLEAVTEALQNTRSDISVTEQRLAAAQVAFDVSQARLADRADVIYRSGSVDMVAVLLGTSTFDDFVTRLDLLNRITTSDAELVNQVEAGRNEVARTQAALQNRESEEVALREQAQSQTNLVEAAVADQKAFVASLAKTIKKLMKAEAARQARIAEELARRAAADNTSYRPSDVGALGQPHPAAVSVARRYLGVPYVWGGESPSGFDCSGLCQYSYRQIGISIPRTSRSQYAMSGGKFIPRSRVDLLEPGDLVFFGTGGNATRIHHVGMYAGGGSFIEAPYTGSHVRYAQLAGRVGDYVGAIRP